MNRYILILCLSLFTAIECYSATLSENKILFKINNQSFTTIDYNNRINYLKLVNDNLEENFIYIVEDYISVILFSNFFERKNNVINLDLEAQKIYNQIKEDLKINNTDNINKQLIYDNIKLDLSRKYTIENFLNERKNEIFEQDNLNTLYKYFISYISINKSNNFNIDNIDDINELKKLLDSKGIKFYLKEKNVDQINSINPIILEKLKINKFNFKIENEETETFIFVTKNFKTYDGLIAKLYQLSTTEYLEKRNLNCNYITNLNDILFKEYEYLKLNENIRDNLLQINDYIIFENNEIINYVFLCDLKFNIDIIKNITTNEKINRIAVEIENNFLKQYSLEYNLIKFYE